MPAPSDAQLQAFADALRGLGVVFLRATAEQTAHATLSKADLLAVGVLGTQGASRMGALAGHLGVGQSAVTPLVDRLEAAGLVRRRRSDADRRAWLVELTDAGRDAFAAEGAAYRRVAAEMLAPLAPDERATLLGLLARIGEATGGPAA